MNAYGGRPEKSGIMPYSVGLSYFALIFQALTAAADGFAEFDRFAGGETGVPIDPVFAE